MNLLTTIAKLFCFAQNIEIVRIIETQNYSIIEGSKGESIRVRDNYGEFLIVNKYTETLSYIKLMNETSVFSHLKALIVARLKRTKTPLAFARKSKGRNGEPKGSSRLMIASLLKSSIDKMDFAGTPKKESPYIIKVIDESINEFRSFDLRTVIGFTRG